MCLEGRSQLENRDLRRLLEEVVVPIKGDAHLLSADTNYSPSTNPKRRTGRPHEHNQTLQPVPIAEILP